MSGPRHLGIGWLATKVGHCSPLSQRSSQISTVSDPHVGQRLGSSVAMWRTHQTDDPVVWHQIRPSGGGRRETARFTHLANTETMGDDDAGRETRHGQ